MKVSKDKLVQFTYYILDDQGETVERVDLPMTTVFMRHNRLYEHVEAVMQGTSVGDEVSATLLPKDTLWGEHDPSLIFVDSIHNVPPEFHRIGAEVQFENESKEFKTFTVTKIDNKTVTLDANHPFAGKIMKFFVNIIKVRDATEQELLEGVASGTQALPSEPQTLH